MNPLWKPSMQVQMPLPIPHQLPVTFVLRLLPDTECDIVKERTDKGRYEFDRICLLNYVNLTVKYIG